MVAIDHETVNLMLHVPHPTTVGASGQIERSGKADVRSDVGRNAAASVQILDSFR